MLRLVRWGKTPLVPLHGRNRIHGRNRQKGFKQWNILITEKSNYEDSNDYKITEASFNMIFFQIQIYDF